MHYSIVFLIQALEEAGTPGLLKLFLCRRLYVCLCVCVSALEAINN